jgi:hypothetical protein
MKIRLFAVLALIAGTVALTAQEPNPYAKSKVGDYATFKTNTKLAGISVGEATLTQTVTAVDAKEATITVTGKVNNQEIQPQEYKIDVTRPFDPTKDGPGLPPGVGIQAEKVKEEKERVEKVKVGSASHDARVESYKAKVKAGGMEFEARFKFWLVKDLPFPVARMELAADIEQQRVEVSMDLVETGNKPVEKKEPEKKEPAKDGKKD